MENLVSILGCKTYEYEKVKSVILDSFINLGGIDKYINKGDKVLLKTNLLMKRKPEEATTTHPTIVRALAEILIEYGAIVIIGDSPGGPFNEKLLKGVYSATGITAISKELNVKLNYNTNWMEVKNKNGLILKKLTVVEMLKDVDKVISVCKLKTHGMTKFTGAVKNMFGIIPGVLKAEYHYRMPEIDDFADALLDICLYSSPILSFMDGIVGMEGEGPSSGNPREVGVVLASNSPYHLDITATKIIGMKPYSVPTIKRSIERGICSKNFDDMILSGENIENFIIHDFDIPEIRNVELLNEKVPKFIRNIINNTIQPKPVFDHLNCIGCNICAENCPPKVIEMKNDRPVVSLDKCIRCFCCQELCPKKTIKIHRPWLMKKLRRL